jgi:hypothetical protein
MKIEKCKMQIERGTTLLHMRLSIIYSFHFAIFNL